MRIVCLLGISYIFCSVLRAQEPAQPLLPATWDIKSEELMDVVRELAKPEFEGRLTGSPGYRLAAEFLAGEFKKLGLIEPKGVSGYFQIFDCPCTLVLPGCSLVLHRNGKDINYHYYDEFMPGSTSASGKVTTEVVFAGYGISAPELDYDDYAGIDVTGRIVLIRPEAPVSPSAGEEKFRPWLPYSLHQYKMKNAIDHGAAGILYHYGPLANTNNEYHKGLVISMVGNKVVGDLFEGTGKDYSKTVEDIGKNLKPFSFPLGKQVTIYNLTEYNPEGKGMNVIGILPGTDPVLKDEVILIGGHLDHCGKCWEVCPGANDNASGIAVMLGVARALAKSGHTFKRTIVFMGIGGEESGLLGSGKYISDPAYPLDKTIGFINLDCVGIGPNLHAGGGLSYPDLYTPLERANKEFVHRNLGSSPAGNAGRPRSDAAVFVRAGVPSVSFSSSGGSGAYHTPGDTPDTIWAETLEDLATLITLAMADLALINPR